MDIIKRLPPNLELLLQPHNLFLIQSLQVFLLLAEMQFTLNSCVLMDYSGLDEVGII